MGEAVLEFAASEGRYRVTLGDEVVELSIPEETKQALEGLKVAFEFEKSNELWKKVEKGLAGLLKEELARRIRESGDPLVLRFSKGAEELLEYPWEFLRDPGSGGYLSLLRPLYRRVGEGVEVPALESRPLKALVVISEPVDALQIGGEGFYETIKESAQKWVEEGRLRLEFLNPPATWEKLSGRLIGEDFDVLHFIGHGDVGRLFFEDEMGLCREIKAGEFFYFFKGKKIRLVVLTACFSGMTARGDVLSGAGTALLEAGIPAVLAMQFPILAQKALDIVRKFYAGFLRTPLPDLLRDVRSALYPVEEGGFIPQWGIPVLYLQDRGGSLLAGVSPGEGDLKGWRERPEIRCRRPEPFVGRERYLRELGEALKGKRFVCISGLSGMGKTALAEEFCHRLHGKRLFPGGVLEVGFEAGGNEETLKGELSRLLTGAEAVPEENLLSVLGERPVLLLLDSFEKAENQDKIYGFLRGLPGQSKAIITSTRDVPWAQNIPLEEMEPDEAVEYFRRRAEMAGKKGWTEKELERVRRICQALGHIPLAIELTAPSSAHLPLSALEQGIEAQLRRANKQRYDLPERHRRIFAAFEYSLGFASEEARDLFLRMSVFPAGGFYEHIAGVAEVPEEEAALLLGELHSQGLVKREGKRYFLQPILRDFALEKLEERGERRKYEENFALSFLALAIEGKEGIERGERRAVGMALVERENLLEAQRWFFEKGRYDECLALSNSLDFLFDRAGLWRKWLAAGERAVKAAKKKGDKKALALALHNLGVALGRLGYPEEAKRHYRESLEIEREVGDRGGIAKSLHQLGRVYQRRGDLDGAERHYRESLEISEQIGNRADMAKSLHQLGMVYELRGDLDGAERHYRESLEIEREVGDRGGIAASLGQLGNIFLLRGDLDGAERHYRESLEIMREVGDRGGIAASLHQLGMVYELRGDLDEAERHYRESLEIEREIGDRGGIAASLGQLGRVYEERGDLDEAERHYRESLEISEQIGNRADMAKSLHQLGRVCERRKDFRKALRLFLEALFIYEELGLPEKEIVRSSLARLSKALGKRRFERMLREAAEEMRSESPEEIRSAHHGGSPLER